MNPYTGTPICGTDINGCNAVGDEGVTFEELVAPALAKVLLPTPPGPETAEDDDDSVVVEV